MAEDPKLHLQTHDSAVSTELGAGIDLELKNGQQDEAAVAAKLRQGAVGGFHIAPLRAGDLLTLHGWKRLLTEGHTVVDAILTVAMAQIGQVMLVWPHQMWLTGITAGIILEVIAGFWNIWTMVILVLFYLERKNYMIKVGTWWEEGGVRRTITQFHEVCGHMADQLAGPGFGAFIRIASQFLVGLSLFGTGIAQVIASAGNLYSIDPSHSKRTYELAFGAALVVFSFVPTFRHYRVLNIVGLIGTTFAEFYIFGTAIHKLDLKGAGGHAQWSPVNMQSFFIGASTLASGGHSNALEMVDAMQESQKYNYAFSIGWLYSYVLTVPHSVAVNLAYPEAIVSNDNVYGLLPITTVKKVSVWLMIIHQFIAWSLYVTPLLFMWEKAIKTHKKPYWIRLPSRLPIALLIWFCGVLFPFYSTVNSLFAAVTGPFIGFLIPCTLFNWFYSNPVNRKNAPFKPPGILAKWNWWPVFIINIILTLVNLVAFTGFGIYYNIKSIIQEANTFGVFPACYQCSG